jgi:hypothetical protein
MRFEHQAHSEHAVLLPALHDIAGLEEDFFSADVLDLQLVDLADLAHLDGLLGERLGQGQRDGAGAGFAVNEIDREVAVHCRTGQAIVVAGFGFRMAAGEWGQAEREGGRQ